MPPPLPAADALERMAFRHPWRTYQRLGVLDRADEVMRSAAEGRWAAALVERGQVGDVATAARRIARMAADHPANHRRELARWLRRERRRLIDRLGDDLQLIGLTATLPDPKDRTSYDNYTGLLGNVTFEVPTPAVVREGDLAPWRDLAWCVEPTPDEAAVLKDATATFRRVVGALLGDDRLRDFARGMVTGERAPLDTDGIPTDPATADLDHLASQLAERPLVTLAAARLLVARDAWPVTLPLPDEAREPLTFDDELAVLERFGLDVLAVSDAPSDHDLLVELRAALTAFGLSLTERGRRPHWPPTPAPPSGPSTP